VHHTEIENISLIEIRRKKKELQINKVQLRVDFWIFLFTDFIECASENNLFFCAKEKQLSQGKE